MGIVSAMANYGATLVDVGLEGDADKATLQQNLTQVYRAKAMAHAQEVAALTRGAGEVGQIRMASSALEGKQRLAYAASGIDATSGTAAQTIESSAIFTELDAATAANNARREALGHQLTGETLSLKEDELFRGFRTRETERGAKAFSAGASVIGEAISMGMGGGAGGMLGGLMGGKK